MTQQPFYWNMNPGGAYNAALDPGYAAAIEAYRNEGLRQSEQQQEDLLAQKQANLKANDTNINGSFDKTFTPDFYTDYSKKLMNYWQPDIDQQHTDAQRQLNFTYADAQPGGGSAPAEGFGRLQKAYASAELAANDQAKSQANSLKGNVEGQRSALLASVTGDTDPADATRSVANTISGIPTAPVYSQLGDLFSNITAQAANAISAARSNGSAFGVNYPGSGSSNSGSREKVFN